MRANTVMTCQITTARLPLNTRSRLEILAKHKNKTKSEIIIDALNLYYEQEENEVDSYTLGLPYFGKYSLGPGDLSRTYKQRVREIIREKHKRQSEQWAKLRKQKEKSTETP